MRTVAVFGILVGFTLLIPGLVVGYWALYSTSDRSRIVGVADIVIHAGAAIGILSGLLLAWSAAVALLAAA
jgi:cytochrome b subunit of formate dehydrogenase